MWRRKNDDDRDNQDDARWLGSRCRSELINYLTSETFSATKLLLQQLQCNSHWNSCRKAKCKKVKQSEAKEKWNAPQLWNVVQYTCWPAPPSWLWIVIRVNQQSQISPSCLLHQHCLTTCTNRPTKGYHHFCWLGPHNMWANQCYCKDVEMERFRFYLIFINTLAKSNFTTFLK